MSTHKTLIVKITNTPYLIVNSVATFHTFRLTIFIQNRVYVHNLILGETGHRIKHKRATVANKLKIFLKGFIMFCANILNNLTIWLASLTTKHLIRKNK